MPYGSPANWRRRGQLHQQIDGKLLNVEATSTSVKIVAELVAIPFDVVQK
jgi:hypothetical protein